MASAAYLKKLRKKYGLGEFRRPRGKAKTRRVVKKAKKAKRKAPARAFGNSGIPWRPGDLGYPGFSAKEDFYREIGVGNVGSTNRAPTGRYLNK
jgi:hypothetical protein